MPSLGKLSQKFIPDSA